LKRYTETERIEIIKSMSKDCLDDTILKTPLADFIPVNEKEKDVVGKLAQQILNVCNKTDMEHDTVVASLAISLFSACTSAYNAIPSPSNLIH